MIASQILFYGVPKTNHRAEKAPAPLLRTSAPNVLVEVCFGVEPRPAPRPRLTDPVYIRVCCTDCCAVLHFTAQQALGPWSRKMYVAGIGVQSFPARSFYRPRRRFDAKLHAVCKAVRVQQYILIMGTWYEVNYCTSTYRSPAVLLLLLWRGKYTRSRAKSIAD